ncbi:MAG: Tfp pilus assembly protein PilF, partial [Gammaproteobacteria bacterium]
SGDEAQAVADYERVLETNPDNVLALNNLAWLYEARGDTRALTMAKKAYDLLPERAEVADTYGWFLVKSGKVEQGLSLLDKALKGAPGNADIRYHQAAALHQAGESKRATALLDELLKDAADFAERSAAEKLLKQLNSH